ncbi:MAG: hypothetical protein ACJAVW_002481, partial [Spirosomataceae bacterium]
RMENGIIKQFKPEFLVKLSKLLGCTIDEIFTQSKNKEELLLSKEQLYKRAYCHKR